MLMERAAKILDFLWPVHNWHPQFRPFEITTIDGERIRGRVMSAHDDVTGNVIHRRMTAAEARKYSVWH